MAKAPLPWFRFYPEAASDKKFIKAARLCGASRLEIMGAWTIILCAAGESPVRGSLYATLQERFSNEDVTDMLGCDPKQTEAILQAFVKMDMLEVIEDAYHVKNWEKRQFESDNSTERSRKHRQLKADSTVATLHQRSNAVSATPPETETDSETDTEKEDNKQQQQPKNIFKLYQDAFGNLASKTISDELIELEKEYSYEWLADAMKETAKNSVKNLNYTIQILSRWKTQGRNTNGKKANQHIVTYQRIGDD